MLARGTACQARAACAVSLLLLRQWRDHHGAGRAHSSAVPVHRLVARRSGAPLLFGARSWRPQPPRASPGMGSRHLVKAEGPQSMSQPLLGEQRSPKRVAPSNAARVILLCAVHVMLSASGPLLLDWVKWHHGGSFKFSIAALTFHAFGFACLLGIAWTAVMNQWRELFRVDMLWRFFITASLFAAADILGFTSVQYLDPGTFSLLGKASGIILTVFFSRALLKKQQTKLQYVLVGIVAASTVIFCQSEAAARSSGIIAAGPADIAMGRWMRGIFLRTSAVALASFAVVVQEKLMAWGGPFLIQQCWMGLGAMSMSLVTMRFVYGQGVTALTQGIFDDWRVLVLLAMYTTNGLVTGLMVKNLGAVAKALCVPVYLGGCYAYAVVHGSAVLSVKAVASWATSTLCILTFAVSKASKPATPSAANKQQV